MRACEAGHPVFPTKGECHPHKDRRLCPWLSNHLTVGARCTKGVRGAGRLWRPRPPSCGLLLDLFGPLLRAANLDLARPHCLRDLTNKIDREQTVYEIGACHLDVVCQVEPTLKCPAGDAMVEIELLLAGILAACDRQNVLL